MKVTILANTLGARGALAAVEAYLENVARRLVRAEDTIEQIANSDNHEEATTLAEAYFSRRSEMENQTWTRWRSQISGLPLECHLCEGNIPTGEVFFEPVRETIDDDKWKALEAADFDVAGLLLCTDCFAAIGGEVSPHSGKPYSVHIHWVDELIARR